MKSDGLNVNLVLAAVVALVTIGAASVILLSGTPTATANVAVVIGLISPTVIALLVLLKVNETHVTVNGRMDQLLATTAKAEFAAGQKQQVDDTAAAIVTAAAATVATAPTE